MIPVASPAAAYRFRQAEFDSALARVMSSGRYILGPEVEALEAEFAQAFGLGHAVSVASGTEALWLALRAVGLGPGDEVLVPSLTASASIAAIVEAGAAPLFVDVRPSDLNLDPAQLAAALTSRTRAVLAVHLYGSPADLTALRRFCDQHDLRLVEDCAQAHGARHAGQPVGAVGDAAAWSFYPTKNLGAFGDGGLVAVPTAALAQRLRLLREYGWRQRYDSAVHGWNSRLDELQAALLRVRLAHLEEDNARRRAIAARYRAALPARLAGPYPAPDDLGVEHLFVIRHPRREAFRQALTDAGVGTAVHYPVPCHLQRAYRPYGAGEGSLPETELAAAQVLSLPMYPELSDAEVECVIAAVGSALRVVPAD
jgi:dTDP-4-amino-4,6-dideoxygalactose transaminase